MENFNSTQNQSIKSQFVQQHIYACMTTLVEYVLAKSNVDSEAPFSYSEIEDCAQYEDSLGNCYTQDEREEQLENWQDELDAIEALLDFDDENPEYLKTQTELELKIADLEDAELQESEVYEWWLVSNWVAKRLAEYHQIILSDGNNAYWGRCTTGQAVLLDSVISRICYDMEILEGQVNSWV